ncbi:MAG: DUF3634 family protein [Sandaracinaceae bacterium]|nr:DUF3634 family protein [Sandaracinaceae bacterium]
MQDLGFVVAIGVVAIAVLLVIARSNELFVLSVRKGRVLLVRGRIPPALMNTIIDVVRRAGIERGTITASRSQGHARLTTRGIDAGTEQRLRNAFGIHPISSLSAAKPPSSRNLGQLLGWGWLAWMLLRSR